jgi:hypothetical protein
VDRRKELERGLHRYIASVAAALGLGPGAMSCGLTSAPHAYLVLSRRINRFPDRDAVLVWNQAHGWAVAVDTGCGEDLITVAYLGPEVVPEPKAVVAFAIDVIEGRHGAEPTLPAAQICPDLETRLAEYAHDS